MSAPPVNRPLDDVHGPHFPILLHYNLLTDPHQALYHRALERDIAPGMRVLDLGTGSGILALQAARRGAEVVAVEADPQLVAVAREIAARHGLADRIAFVNADAEAFEPDGRFDRILCEMQDTAGIRERQTLVMNRARRWLAPDGATIARGVRDFANLCRVDYGFDGFEIPLPFFETQEVRPVRERVHPPVEFRHLRFDRENDPAVDVRVIFAFDREVAFNAFELATVTEVVPGVTCGGSDWFNAPFIMPLNETWVAWPGDRFALRLRYTMGEGLRSLSFDFGPDGVVS